jgi:hypothetical protein
MYDLEMSDVQSPSYVILHSTRFSRNAGPRDSFGDDVRCLFSYSRRLTSDL